MVLGAAVGIVAADSPNPDPNFPTIATTAVLNGDGSTTITLNGNWYWPTHKSDCNTDRYAAGWAIDWNDPNQPGNPLATLNGQLISVGVAKANQYNPWDNLTHFYDGPNPPRCGVYDPAKGYNSGAWGPMTHTYAPGISTFAPCVVTYDIHGSADKGPNSGDLYAGDGVDQNGNAVKHAHDNSVETNKSTPAGNGCYSATLQPDLEIVKTAPTQVTVGDSFTYGLAVSNVGTVTVASPVVTDDIPSDLTIDQSSVDSRCQLNGQSLSCNLAALAPGASATPINLKVTTTKVGTEKNTGVVGPPDSDNTNNQSTVTTNVVDTPTSTLNLSVQKTNDANQDGVYHNTENAKSVGQTVSFQLKVSNNSPVPVVVDSITDAYGTTTINPTCSPDIVGTTLAAGGTATCTFDVANYAPANSTTLDDTATVNVHDATKPSNKTSAHDSSTVGGPGTVLISMSKSNDANQDNVFSKSETAKQYPQDVKFALHINNPSSIPVVVGSITDQIGSGSNDPLPANNDCPKAGDTLQPNADITCFFTETAYAPNFGSPDKVNTASIDVHEVNNPGNHIVKQDTSTVKAPPLPVLQLTVDKKNDANSDGTFNDTETARSVGQDVKFQAVVTNASGVSMVIDSITDDWPGMPAGFTPTFSPNLVGTALAPGASKTITFTVPNYGPAKGSTLTDTLTVGGHQQNVPSNTTTGSDKSTVAGPGTVVASIEKTNNADQTGSFGKVETANTAGQDVDFQLKVTNPSSNPVTVSSLTDAWDGHADAPLPTGSACAALVGTTLTAGQSKTCTFTETGYAPAEGAAARTNTATVVLADATNPTNTATAQDTSTVNAPALPALSITVDKKNDANQDKTFTDGETGNTAGQSVEFQVTVDNTSAVPVVVSSITDAWPGHADAALPAGSGCAGLVGSTIPAGQSKTCTYTEANYVPASGSSVVNTVTVKVTEPNNPGNTTTGTDTSTVTGPNTPVLSLNVIKLNDANNDGTYTDNETSPTAGAAVKFQVTVQNTSAVPVTINTVTDEWPGRPAFSLATDCPALIGRVLQPGDTTAPNECQWAEANYAPPVGTTLVNTVRVNGVQAGSGNNTVAGNDTTSVQSGAQVLAAVVSAPPATPTAVAPAAAPPAAAPAALPRTGRDSFLVMLFGGLLFLAGAMLVAGSDPMIGRRLRRIASLGR
jgi:uncharacterized repeat protein (TIGR01451 family)